MLSKCANPGCTATFLYLHDGKLFRLDISSEIPVSSSFPQTTKPAQRIEFFWLCTPCAAELTIDYQKGRGVTVVPLLRELIRAASAPQV